MRDEASSAGIDIIFKAKEIAHVDIKAMLDKAISINIALLIFDVVVLIVSLILIYSIYMVQKRVIRPLSDLQTVLITLADGDLEVFVLILKMTMKSGKWHALPTVSNKKVGLQKNIEKSNRFIEQIQEDQKKSGQNGR